MGVTKVSFNFDVNKLGLIKRNIYIYMYFYIMYCYLFHALYILHLLHSNIHARDTAVAILAQAILAQGGACIVVPPILPCYDQVSWQVVRNVIFMFV